MPPPQTNKPRRGMRQGILRVTTRHVPGHGVQDGATHQLLNRIMTLGNGYLGSRIDEERSKMRYLV
ncbi:hypothetical protein LINPERHAP2_LOCUS20441 [Linum perenne]